MPQRVLKRSFGGERWFCAVALANLVLGTSSVLIPLMLSRVLERGVGTLGILSGLVSLVGVIGSLLWGRLSDAAHRRKHFVVVSYTVVGLCLLGMAIVPSYPHFLWINMLMNFFWVANASVTVLIVIENRAEAEWEAKVGRLNQIGALGWVGGLVLGSGALALSATAVSEEIAIRGLFASIAVAGLLAGFLAFRRVPRTVPKYTRREFRGISLALGNLLFEVRRFSPFHLYHRLHPRRVLEALRDPRGFKPGTRRFLTATFVSFLGLGLFGIPLPFLLSEQFGLSSWIVFAYFALQHLGVVIAFPLAARRIKRLGNRHVQITTIAVRFLLFATTAVFLSISGSRPPIPALLVGFSIYGLTWSYFQLSGIALVSRLAKAENRGMVLGLYNALAGIGWVIAGISSGALAAWAGYQATSAAGAGLLLIALLIVMTVPQPKVRPVRGQAIVHRPPEGAAVPSAELHPSNAG